MCLCINTEESFGKEIQPDEETGTQRSRSLGHGHTAWKWRTQDFNSGLVSLKLCFLHYISYVVQRNSGILTRYSKKNKTWDF